MPSYRKSGLVGPRTALLIGVLLVAGMSGACSGGDDAEAASAAADQIQALTASREALQAKRAELADLQAQIAAGADALEIDEASEQTKEEAFAELQARAESLGAEIDGLAETFMTDLVAFINSQEMEVGAEPTPEQQAALTMKSGEDLIYAQEYIDKGGDYARAEEIVKRAMQFDPDNPELQAKLDWIEEMRYMTKERFDQVEKGMSEDQVRALLGPVNINNVKEFEGNRKGWFYRKDPETEGGAAGVYFQQVKGKWTVYEADYEAIKPSTE